jgi:hypothetical protein
MHHIEETEYGLLPTTIALDRQTTIDKTNVRQKKYGGKTRAMYLSNFLVMGMLPTPTTALIKHSNKEAYWKNRKNKGRQEDLAMVIHNQVGYTSQLNPLFVEEMMGFPKNWTTLPFLNGETNQLKPTETL